MASIIKRMGKGKGKKQRYAYYVKWIDENGKQRMKRASTDHDEAVILARKWEDDAHRIKRGDIDPQNEARKIERAKSMNDHLAQYKTSLQAAGRDKNHVAYTIRDIELFMGVSATSHAATITRPQVDSWVLGMMQAKVDANRTINRRVGSLQAFLKWLDGQHVITDYVLHKFPKLATGGVNQKRKRRALTADEIIKLLAQAPADRADIYRFALLSGARYSAVTDLKVSDIDFDHQTMGLKKKTKGGKLSVYVVPIHPALVPILKKLVDGMKRDDHVFAMMRRENAAKLVKADCKAAGIDTMHVDFHCLRHTFITLLAQANVHPKVTQELAGHSTIEMTLGFYTHFQRADKVTALGMLKVA